MKVDCEIPEEIQDMFASMAAHEECRDVCVGKVFGWKRAAYFAKKSLKERMEAWAAIYEIYPNLKGKACTYSFESKKIVMDQPDEETVGERK